METTGRTGRGTSSKACIDPGAITPEDIVAYVDGEAALPVVGHVRRCPHCAAEARDLARTAGTLRQALYRFDCPQPHALGEYELDQLSPEERTAIAVHVVECLRCTEELDTLRGFLRAEPALSAEPTGVAGWLKRVVATLVGPTPRLAPVWLRGAGDSGAKTYQAGDVTISIDPGPETKPGRGSILGLVVREGPSAGAHETTTLTGSEVRLIAPDGTTQTGEIDDLSNFAFDDLTPGTYRLEVQLADQIVVVQDVRMGGT